MIKTKTRKESCSYEEEDWEEEDKDKRRRQYRKRAHAPDKKARKGEWRKYWREGKKWRGVQRKDGRAIER